MRFAIIVLAGMMMARCVSTSAELQENPSQPPSISQEIISLKLGDCLQMALVNNLDLVIERVNPDIAAQKVRGEQGAFDPNFSAGVAYEDNTTPLASQASIAAGGLQEVETQTLSYLSSIEGKIPTGTEYSFSYDQSRTDSTFNRFRSEYDTFAGVAVAQPILKDFWLDNQLALVRIARKDHQISRHAFQVKVIDILARVRNAYWDLVFAIEDAKVQKESLRLAEDLLKENRKRVEVGVLSPLEITQAEAGVAQREESVIVSERVIRDQENILKRLIYSDLSSLVFARIEPVDAPSIQMRPIDTKESIQIGLKGRPELRQQKEEVEKLKLRVKYDANQTLPRIDLEGSYGLNGLKKNPGSSFDDALSDDNPVWTIGATMEVPLWNRTKKSTYEISQLQKKQTLSKLKQTEQQIIVEVDNACRLVQSNLKRVEATRASRKFAEEALSAEETKLKNGASTSHNVLEFQEELTKARTAEIKSIVDYNKSLNELAKAQGTVLKELGIEIAEK